MMRPAKQHRPGLWTVSPNRRAVAAKRDIGDGLRGADVAAFQCRSEELARGEETGNLPPAIGEEFDTPEHAAHDPVNVFVPPPSANKVFQPSAGGEPMAARWLSAWRPGPWERARPATSVLTAAFETACACMT